MQERATANDDGSNTRLPVATVITATHNHGHWLMNAIDSVLAQDYPNIQLAICNDGSHDETHKMCLRLLDNDNIVESTEVQTQNGTTKLDYYIGLIKKIPLYYIHSHTPTGGPSQPRNLLIDYTWDTTNVFCPLDADDWFMPNRLSRCLEKIIEHPDQIAGVWSDYFTVDMTTGIKQTVVGHSYSSIGLDQKNIIHSACCINKLALEQVIEDGKYYDESMRTCEDYDLWLRLSEHMIFAHVAEPLLYARIHKDNSTNAVDEKVWKQNWQKIRDKTHRRRNVKAQ